VKPARPLPSNARAIAAHVLEQVIVHGRYLDTALDTVRTEAASDAALVQELTYGTLRWFHQLAGIAAVLLTRPLKPKDQDVHALLLAGLYQLRALRVATHAAVDETVAATAALGKPWAKGLINACLREYLRRNADVAKLIDSDPALKLSHPAWLLEKFRDAWPEDQEHIAQANNERPPLTLRVNLRRQARDAYREKLHAANITVQPTSILDTDVTLMTPVPVATLPGFATGEVSVQDAAAQWATVLLDAQPGERVLDACAAPGGKTGHILERTPGLTELVALDRDPARVALIEQNLRRLGFAARLLAADATEPGAWWDRRPFDRILLDVPCSATGVIRRHPDIKLRRQPGDLPKLTATQARLLAALWPLLRPGGKLLYVTCSILPEENEQQIAAFLARENSAAEAPLPTTVGRARAVGRQILPGDHGMDGFYYAGLVKK